jgi:hypothetical protein
MVLPSVVKLAEKCAKENTMRKMRKFNDGGSTDAEEAKYKAAGLAASNAENKPSGFLGLGRLFQGNIDQKGSEAYEKYGAGAGRRLEAEKATKAPEAAAKAPEAKTETETSDKSYDALESKRLSSSASTPDETPDKSYDALESKRLSSPTPAPRVNKPGEDAMAIAASKVDRSPAPAAKTAPAAKPAAKTAPAAKPAAKTAPAKPAAKSAPAPAKPAAKVPAAEPKVQRARLDVPNAAGPRSAANPMSRDPSQRSAPTPAPAAPKPAPAAKPVDETKLSLSERMKLSRERAKSSSTGTDTRPVGQRIRESLGMKKGGGVKGYASGGSVSSRADGIAQRGKTRGRMC